MARPLPWAFPYVRETSAGQHPLGRETLRPLVDALVVGPSGPSNRYGALVDSGCDYVLVTRQVADEAGIDSEAGIPYRVFMGGEPREIRVVHAEVRLCDPKIPDADEACRFHNVLEWTAQVGIFINWSNAPFQMVLGQVGFFDQFTVSMNHAARAVVIENLDELAKRHELE